MGVDVYKRNKPEVARKLALIFDWSVDKSGTEDFGKIVSFIDSFLATLFTRDSQTTWG